MSRPEATATMIPEVVTQRRPKVKVARAPRIRRYIVTQGWLHLTLLCGVMIFLFPFAWMISTSLKTDEELTSAGWPGVPRYRPVSPYVRPAPVLIKPGDVPADRWQALSPRLREITRQRLAMAEFPTSADGIDREQLLDAASAHLLNQLVARINTRLWSQDETALVDAYEQMLTSEALTGAIDARLGRLELRQLQIRTFDPETLDAQITNVCTGEQIAHEWRVESGDARLIPAGDATTLAYNFDSKPGAVVLRYDFDFPGKPENLHKLIVSIKADDSWHTVHARLDVAGETWTSDQPSYIAQHRPGSIFFQPPGFDDTTYKAKTWITLRRQGSSSQVTSSDADATLRITLTPSSTAGAIYGKVRRNYARAFNSVPFWTYVGNSLLLVVLTTAGTLFSSAFVAYAFARLAWPGRTVAFVILLSTMMLPAQVTMIPSFLIWRHLGWYNTLNPLWVPAWFGGAFFIFLMVQHMKTIPRELEEAARIDGLGALGTWALIIVPQVKPALAAIAIMTFMGAWNEFMGPLIYLRDQSKFPLSLGLFGVRLDSGGDWTMIMAGNVLMTLPVMIIFFLFQRYFIQGMTMSGMKG